MEPLIEVLRGLGTDLFAIVEQDMYPCDPDAPFPVADRTHAFLQQLWHRSAGALSTRSHTTLKAPAGKCALVQVTRKAGRRPAHF